MQHHLIQTWEEFQQLEEYFNSQPIEHIVIDTETDNKVERKANLYGVGLAISDSEAFYIPFIHQTGYTWWYAEYEHRIIEWICNLIKKYGAIGHNIIYDVLVLKYNWGIDLTDYIYSDTILQKHTLHEDRPHGLKEVAEKYLFKGASKAQDKLFLNITQNGGKTTKDQLDIYKADTDVIAEYCAWDCMLTFKLFNLFEPKLKSEGLYDLFYNQEIMPLYRLVTIPMKDKGFPVDVEHFRKLDYEIQNELYGIEENLQKQLHLEIKEYEEELLNKDYPVKRSGKFPKAYALALGLQLPLNKDGTITLAKKEIEKIKKEFEFKNKLNDIIEERPIKLKEIEFLSWITNKDLNINLDDVLVKKAQRALWLSKGGVIGLYGPHEERYVFNLRSNNDLKYLFFDKLSEQPLSTTEKGEPQIDDEFLESVKHKYPWVQDLIDFKKLTKLKTTYVEGILEKQINGVIYPSLLQFGTTSGRYSSINPNLQNLPRAKEEDSGLTPRVLKYVNAIRAGFVAPKDYVLIDADESALEPRCFASMSGAKSLQEVFDDPDQDLYSFIAIKMFKETGVSSNKKRGNYLGKLKPELRGIIKAFCLAVVYGAKAKRISDVLGVSKERAQELIDMYFAAFPELKYYIDNCHKDAKIKGQVKTIFGRVRHLPRVKYLYGKHKDNLLNWNYVNKYGLDQEKYEYNNGLNNSTNFPIQGLAAHIMNRSAINIACRFKEENINGYIALQVHDELIHVVHKDDIIKAKSIVQHEMENSVKIAVPLLAEPKIAMNLKDSH